MNRFSLWRLRRAHERLILSGYTIVPPNFAGVLVAGSCFVTGTKVKMQVWNPSGVVIGMNSSLLDFRGDKENPTVVMSEAAREKQ